MADFLRALGWVEGAESEPSHRLFQGTNGIVVALYAASNYEPHFGPRADGFRGFTLGLNLANAEEVDRAYEFLQTVDGAELLEEPFDSPHVFRGFSPSRSRGQHLGRGLEARLDRDARRRPDLVVLASQHTAPEPRAGLGQPASRMRGSRKA
jgi:hypothetical protein